nr:pentatricopeptide repeat-containing protein [Tanacetum cinerariifolium]
MGNPLPGRRSVASGPPSRHLWKAGSVTTYTLPFTPYHRAFSSVAGFGGPKLTWLRQKASSLKAWLARHPSHSARSRPAALPKPIIISVPRPHCWKGSASKPYVELPPHTAPLWMEVVPNQICSVFSVAEKRSLPPAFKNDEYEVREAASTMDPLTPNWVAFPGLAGVACRS